MGTRSISDYLRGNSKGVYPSYASPPPLLPATRGTKFLKRVGNSEPRVFLAVRRNLRARRALNPRVRPTNENRKRNPFEGGADANSKDRSASPMGRKTGQIAPPEYQHSRKGKCLRRRPAPTSPSRMPFGARGILASCSPSAKCPGLGRKVVSRLKERPPVLRVRCRLPISTARAASAMAAFGYWGIGRPRPANRGAITVCYRFLLFFAVFF